MKWHEGSYKKGRVVFVTIHSSLVNGFVKFTSEEIASILLLFVNLIRADLLKWTQYCVQL